MRIAVFVKQVVDVAEVTVDELTGAPVVPATPVLNTFDAYGVGEAVELKEQYGGEVVAVTAGPARSRDALMRALATGADSGVHVLTDALGSVDSLTTARLLAEAVRNGDFDVLIAGQTSDDYENGQVGIQVAELLGIPHVSLVTNVQDEGATLLVERDFEGSKQTVRVPKPVMLVMLTGRNGPRRYASLKGMMQAKRKPVQEVAASIEGASPLTWGEPVAPPKSASGIMVDGQDASAAATQLVSWLREQRLVG